MEYFELQPLRIPSGWTVQYNNFSEYDLEKDGEKYRFELVEDLLQLKNHNLLIDLGYIRLWMLQGNKIGRAHV